MMDRLTAATDPTILVRSAEIDRICERYKADWRAGRMLPVADVLLTVVDDLRPALETELLTIVDPVRHAAAITQPKIIALGTNDEYWPLESLDLYRGQLRAPTWVSYAPNSGHDIPPLRVAPLVAALGRHVAGVEPLPDVAWSCDTASRICALAADPLPAETLLWTAASDTRDFRAAKWTSQRVKLTDGRCREPLQPPAAGFRAAVVECRYARAPLPVYLSTGPLVVGRA